jgi:hypothetical protein
MSFVDEEAIADEVVSSVDAPTISDEAAPISPWLLLPPIVLASNLTLVVDFALCTFARAWVVNSPQEEIKRAHCLKLFNFRFRFGAIRELYNRTQEKWFVNMHRT